MDRTTPTAPRPEAAPGRRSRRRLLAGMMALAGAGAIALALSGGSGGSKPESARTAGSLAEEVPGAEPVAGEVDTAATDTTGAAAQNPGLPPSDKPGGVGQAPERTGLPAKAAEGGQVRTGTREEGCFPDMRSYLDQWDRTGTEPEPCFTAQPASEQDQPKGVQRTYNGEKF